MWFEQLAVWCQDAALADAVEQRRLDAALELANALAYGRLCDVQFFRGQGKGFMFGNREEGVDLIQLHGRLILFQIGMKIMKIMN